MSLFDFFFPEQAQASHLRSLADTTSLANTQARIARSRQDNTRASSEKRIAELADEVSQLTIIVEALLEKLSENGSLTRADLAEKVAEIDARDGVIDGRITKREERATKQASKVKLNFPDAT